PGCRGLAGRCRRLQNVRNLHNSRLKRAGIRLLVASGFFRGQGDGPADLSPDKERYDERREKAVFEQILMIKEPPLRGGEIMIDAWLPMADRPSGRRAVEREEVARLQIFFPILRFALQIAGHSQDLDIA